MTFTNVRAVTGLVVLSLLALTVVFAGSAAAQTADPPVCAGNASDFAGGDGTAGAPYQIETVDELQCVGDPVHLDGHFELVHDVDASATASWHTGSGFEPIGDTSVRFNGTFDGQGFAVSDLAIDRPGSDYVGLFGFVDSGGAVSNVGVENATIAGADYVGGLVGQNEGTVSESYATGAVSGTVNVGGLVGWNFGDVSESYATGNVSGGFAVGGLVGENFAGGTVSESYATGSVSGSEFVGGLVGRNELSGTVSESYATGTVSGNNDVGGLVGINQGTVSASYWNEDTNDANLIGVGVGSDSGVTNLTTAEMTGEAAFDHMTGLDVPDTFVLNESYPHLRFQDELGGDGSEADPYEIRTVYHLQSTAGNLSASYVLAEDVDASATASWHTGSGFTPIGDNSDRFTGSFDGQGFNVSGLTINRSNEDSVGMFGFVGIGGTVTDVGAENATITGDSNVGGLVGRNDGTVSVSYATGSVSGTELAVGGLVGRNIGTVNGSYVTGTVSGTGMGVGGLVGINQGTVSESYATGDVSGDSQVGGLVGRNSEGTVSGSYATGSVSGTDLVGGLVGENRDFSTVSESYATGSVSGSTNVGGLVGGNAGPVNGSYWNEDTNDANLTGVGDGSATGVTNLTTDEMTGVAPLATMTGLDFTSTWVVSFAYPRLAWEADVPNGYVVTIDSVDDAIDAGQTLTVDVRIDNIAQQDDTQDIEFVIVDDTDATVHAVVEEDLALDSGDNASLIFEWPTADDEHGDYTVTVSSDDDSASASVAVAGSSSGSGSGSDSVPRRDPASFELSALTVDTDSILTGESVTVTATLTNVGERSGTHQVTLGLDGTDTRVTSVSLDGGDAETVTLTHTFDVAGEYALTLDGQAVTTLAVVDPTSSPSTTASPPTTAAVPPTTSSGQTTSASPAVSTTETPGQPGFGLVVAVLGLLAAVLLGVRRRA